MLESLLLLVSIELRRIGDLLADGDISRVDWRMMTDRLVAAGHLAAAELAVEEEEDLIAIPILMGNVERSREGIDTLNAEYAAGIVAVTQIAARTQQFGNAPRRSYYGVGADALDQLGYTLWESVLGQAEHCPECLSEAAKDPRPLPEIVPIGNRICNVGCQCSLRAVNTRNGDVAII